MELLADRFWVTTERVIDLASGAEVTLLTSSAGGRSEQLRWVERCDRLSTIHQPDVARLLDFGPFGESRRFEVWRATADWVPSCVNPDEVRARANRFLEAGGLSPTTAARVLADRGQAVVVPDPEAGYACAPAEVPSPPCDLPVESCALEHLPRPAVTAIAELLADANRVEPCAIALWGEPGAGLSTATLEIARTARMHGLIPVAATIDEPAVWEALANRSILVIDPHGDGRGWRRLVAAGLRSVRSHLLLLTGREEARHVHNVHLERMATERLRAAVWPHGAGARYEAALERAAVRARGLPGVFVRQLWGKPPIPIRSRASECKASYIVTPRSAQSASLPVRVWPVPGDVGALRRQLMAATEGLPNGRLVSADRDIRSYAAALARRGDHGPAACGLFELAQAWLRRGRLDSARTAAREVGELAKIAGDDRGLIDAATLSGRICTEAGELSEAESLLRGSLAAARLRDDRECAAACNLALARSLFWQGRYDEAARCLEGVEPATEALRTTVAVARTEVAIGRRAHVQALSLVTAAIDSTERDAAALIGPLSYAAAFAHLAVGDHVAVQRDVEQCVKATRRARDPLLALHAQLLGAESERRCGRARQAAFLLAKLGRVARASLPATTWARVDALRVLGGPAGEAGLDRLVNRTGLIALRLFAPDPIDAASAADVDDTLALLHLCQRSEDEAGALDQVCAALRRALRAAAVGFVASRGQGGLSLATDGKGLDQALAERVLAAGQPVQHDPPSGGPEIGVPVTYAGRLLAVVLARWTAGSAVDFRRVSGRLVVAAAAVGPLVAAVMARLASPQRPDDLVGESTAMSDLRRAIERAAAAPYAVLVEGESGSGKELIARAVHRQSARRDHAFCAVNCAALPDDLLEAELFGHARGAFTGAVSDRPGVFEEANGGTLFLDEVGELSARAQAKLLRAIQDGELRRLGENAARRVDVRIVAATNRDLRHEVVSGRFRLDLLYRLDVIRVTVPPLRERADDIPALVEHYWREVTERLHSRAVLSAHTLAALGQYSWPGNVRELQNVLAALAVRCPRRGVIAPSALPPNVASQGDSVALTLRDARRTFEARFIRAALVRTGGHHGRAAEELGLSRQGLTKLLGRLGIGDAKSGDVVQAS